MGRPLKIKSPEEMERLWQEYKQVCDDQEVLTHEFSSKNSEFVSAKLKRSITYTIEGFCVYPVSYTHLDVYKRQPPCDKAVRQTASGNWGKA